MATLPVADRQRIKRGLARYLSILRERLALSDSDFQAAIDATDTWIDTNAAAYNTALPVAARNNLTATQKTLLFVAVALMRQGLGFLKYVFTEAD
jgi:hypothetical protein